MSRVVELRIHLQSVSQEHTKARIPGSNSNFTGRSQRRIRYPVRDLSLAESPGCNMFSGVLKRNGTA